MAGDRLIAPWPKRRASSADLARLDAVLEQVAALAQAHDHPPTWLWPDRPPQPVADANMDWLRAWARDRAVYLAA